MGPRPPPASPSSSSLPNFLSSAADDWLFGASDRDTQIITQALSICSRGGTAPACSSSSSSSQFPAPASANPFYETFSRCLDASPLQNQSFEALRTLQKQQQLQQQLKQVQQQRASSMLPRHGDGFSKLEQASQQKGSPLLNNSSESFSASAEAPASPFSTSTLSPNSSMSTIATESFLAYSKPQNPQHHDSHNGRYACESSRSSNAASIALSSQASVGVGGCKVSKRRSRTSCKTPIAVLSADTTNFRAMVQQLTGIPTSSSMQSFTHGGLPLLKPQPIRNNFTNTLNLPTLDTSACFLGPKNPSGMAYAKKPYQPSTTSSSAYAGVDLSKGEVRNGYYTTPSLKQHVAQSVLNDQSNGMINQSLSSLLLPPDCRDSAESFKVRGSFSSLLAGEQVSMKQGELATAPASLDSLLADENTLPKTPMGAVDSWLPFFEGAHANNMEIARMA